MLCLVHVSCSKCRNVKKNNNRLSQKNILFLFSTRYIEKLEISCLHFCTDVVFWLEKNEMISIVNIYILLFSLMKKRPQINFSYHQKSSWRNYVVINKYLVIKLFKTSLKFLGKESAIWLSDFTHCDKLQY